MKFQPVGWLDFQLKLKKTPKIDEIPPIGPKSNQTKMSYWGSSD